MQVASNRIVNMVLHLSFACWDYDRMKAIEDGRVRPEGIDLTFLNYRVEETSAHQCPKYLTLLIQSVQILSSASIS